MGLGPSLIICTVFVFVFVFVLFCFVFCRGEGSYIDMVYVPAFFGRFFAKFSIVMEGGFIRDEGAQIQKLGEFLCKSL